ncbi:YopX family protein [Bacillus sonorensis]|uniref:YopX family protein n=1 Tax=Bacillus sonorensis TaxID=119858 RepID=UPI002DBFA11E|nr:YopX family protein [Bacillus sonorensis]MEC1426682.1 YopX family protein [Bacillus sonorensis]
MTHLHYRVWDGEQMYYSGDEGLCLSIGEMMPNKVFGWSLWLDGYGVIAHSGDEKHILMWGTGEKDDEGKMIYPGDVVEYYIGTFTLLTHEREKIRMTQRIFISGGNHDIPLGYGENLKVIGNLYELEAAE